MLLISFLFFILLFFTTFYIPGRYVVRISKILLRDRISEITLSVGFGIAIFLFMIYTLSWVHLVSLYYIFLIYCLIQEIRFFFQIKKNSFSINFNRNIFLILVGSLFTASLTWTSGLMIKNGMQFYGVNAIDGIVHMSLIHQFIDQFPPMTPYLAGIPFRGYHFFYDFMIANFAILFPFFSVTDLFFRFFCLILALFYGFSGLFFAKHFKMNKVATTVFIFLLYFAQGLQSLMPFILHVPIGSYNTGIIQSLQHIFDPTVLFASAFIFLLVPLFFSIKTKREFLFVILLLGILPMVKIYAAIMVYIGFGITSAIILLQKKDWKFLFICFLSGIVSLYVYAPLNLGAGKLLFAPFLLYRHFIEGSSAFVPLQWALKYQFYTAEHNTLRILWLYSLAIFWYFIPTLGLRFVLLLKLNVLRKKSFYTPENIFWIVVCFIGFLIPTFFIQSVDVFNILQFIWFSYIFLLIPTAIVLSKLFTKNILLNTSIYFFILFISLPDIIALFLGFSQPPTIIPKKTVIMSQIVSAKVPQRDAIIIVGDGFSAPVMAALTGRQIYYEPTSLGNAFMESVGKQRQDTLQILTNNLQNCSLAKMQVRNIVSKTHNKYMLVMQPSHCFSIGKQLARVNQEVLYKL